MIVLTTSSLVIDIINLYFYHTTKVKRILDMYKDHHSILKITNNHDGQLFILKPVSVQDMENISHENPLKSTEFDQFPPTLIWTAGFAISPSLTSLVNHTIACSQFPADHTCAELSPVFTKDDILDKSAIHLVYCLAYP